MTGDGEVSQRTRDAEARRRVRMLMDAGSLGSPGARIMREYRAWHWPLSVEDQAAVDAEMADLERELKGWRA